MNFKSFDLPDQLMMALERLNFQTPTTIQEQAIPLILQGNDLLASSQTGTGKTGAFAIPIISKIMGNKNNAALIITPTRELAAQIQTIFDKLIPNKSDINTVLLIGGSPIKTQLNKLKLNPNIIIGTPGRINDHLKRRSLRLANVNFLVLDETDRMLDMGFSTQIDDIIKQTPNDRQTLLFSATIPPEITKVSAKYMKNPKRISVGSTSNPIEKIKQEVIKVQDHEKYQKLVEELNKRSGSVIIFMKTKYSVERMIKKLKAENFEVDGIHGDLSHNKREQVIKKFRDQKFLILVATDIVARGLDIPHIGHVINYDIPQCPEDYIHRIGRTGRAGNEGESVSFVTNAESKKWDAIRFMMNPELKNSEKTSKNVRPENNKNSAKPSKNNIFRRRNKTKNHR